MTADLESLTQVIYSISPPTKAVLYSRIDQTGKIWRPRLFALREVEESDDQGGEIVLYKGYMALAEIKKKILLDHLVQAIEEGAVHLMPASSSEGNELVDSSKLPNDLIMVLGHSSPSPLLLPMTLAQTPSALSKPKANSTKTSFQVQEEVMEVLTSLIRQLNEPGRRDRARKLDVQAEGNEETNGLDRAEFDDFPPAARLKIVELEEEIKRLRDEKVALVRGKQDTEKQLRDIKKRDPHSLTHPAAKIAAKPQPKGASLLQPAIKKAKKIEYGFEDDDDADE